MASLDMAAFASSLKQIYTNDAVKRMTYEDHPFFALVPKMEKFEGKNLPIPIIYGNPQGRSTSFTYSKANKTAGKYKDFTLTRVSDYGLCSIDSETIEASQSNAGAFLEAFTSEMDGTLSSLTSSLATSLYRSGSGSIGKIASTVVATTGTIPLDNPEDVVHFEVGQTLVASAADGTGTVKSTTGTQNIAIVTNIDRINGIITVDRHLDDFGSEDWAAADYLFVQGDYNAKLSGLDAWIPATAPTSSLFFGCDRSVDTRLGGLRMDISSYPIEEGLITGINLAMREQAKISHVFMNYNRFSILEKSLGSKVNYVDVNSTVGVGFRGIQINTGKGPVTVLADQDCQDDVAWGLQMNTWKLYTLGQAPKILNLDGNKFLRDTDTDSVELRTAYRGQLGCNAPGWNIRLKLA